MGEENSLVLAALLNLEPTGGLEPPAFSLPRNALHACRLWRAGRFLRPEQWLQSGHTMATDVGRSLTPSAPICIPDLAPDQGFEPRTLRLTDRCTPFKNRRSSTATIAGCRQMPWFLSALLYGRCLVTGGRLPLRCGRVLGPR